MTVYFVGFYTLFDIAPNFYAELSGLQDRQFYQDFWNSSNFDEYARKWNKLVHEFLYRHFYLEYLINYKCTVYQASIATFAFSTLFHELCFVSVFRTFTPFLTTMQVAQLIFIKIFNMIGLRGTIIGNGIFWIGLIQGVMLSLYLYTYDFYNLNYNE
jgi:sterol O-acyltransferase